MLTLPDRAADLRPGAPRMRRPRPRHGTLARRGRHLLRRGALAVLRRWFNPLALRLLRGQGRGRYAILEHQGRRSGRAYRTPVQARPVPAGFVIPLTWGEQTDWFRNVRAAGRCVLHWQGATYRLGQPRVVELDTGEAAFAPLERLVLRRARINLVYLQRATD